MDFNLPRSGVEVWTLQTGTLRAAPVLLERVLTAGERERANRFRFPHLRRDYVLAHASLRLLCAGYLKADPVSLKMSSGPNGKPELGSGCPLRFNMSHSGGLTAFAFAWDLDLGIDVERVREIKEIEGIAHRFFCREEAAEVLEAAEPERTRLFHACWTRKEAFIKATGDGLSMPLDSFRVNLKASEPARLLHVNFDSCEASHWTLQNLNVPDSYAGALCYRGSARPLTYRQLDPSLICNLNEKTI